MKVTGKKKDYVLVQNLYSKYYLIMGLYNAIDDEYIGTDDENGTWWEEILWNPNLDSVNNWLYQMENMDNQGISNEFTYNGTTVLVNYEVLPKYNALYNAVHNFASTTLPLTMNVYNDYFPRFITFTTAEEYDDFYSQVIQKLISFDTSLKNRNSSFDINDYAKYLES